MPSRRASLPFDLPRLGYGAGGNWGSSRVRFTDALRLIERYADAVAVPYFDTGPTYSGGEAEARLGRCVAELGLVPRISTKVGSHLDRGGTVVKDYSPSALRRSLEASLERLRRPAVDLVLIHGPLREEQLTDELLDAMQSFTRDGLAAAVGASCDGAVARAAIRSGALDCVMTTVNVLEPDGMHTARVAAAAGLDVLVKSPLAHVAYNGSWLLPRTRAGLWSTARLLARRPRYIARAAVVRSALGPGPVARVSAALRYAAFAPAVVTAVVGTTRLAHLQQLLDAAERGPLDPASTERITHVARPRP